MLLKVSIVTIAEDHFVNVEEQAIWESSPCLCIGLTWEISLFKY
jgi:hypothetical protein